MSRQSIVAPIGLITQPNKYGQYKRGALSRADNVVMRSPGIISSMPDTTAYRTTISAANIAIRSMLAAPASLLVYLEEALTLASAGLDWVTTGAANVVTHPSGLVLGAIAGRARFATQRTRYYFTCWNTTTVSGFRGVIALDSEGDTTSRMAGLSQPAYLDFTTGNTTNAIVMGANKTAAWRAIVRRTHSDGYDMSSAASWAMTGTTGATPIDPQVIIGFPMNHNYIVGDIVELYRTRTQDLGTDPGDTMFLAVSQAIVAGDITAGFISIRDVCQDDSLGVELYSNAGQEGASAANLDPPVASDMASFKGHMFYAATAVPAQAKMGKRVASAVLSTDYDRLYGIGFRTTTGTITNGSPTITVVVNMRGIVPGQFLFHANFPGGSTTITGVTATTITCANNATATTAGASFTTYDTIKMAAPPNLVAEIQFSPFPNVARITAMAAGTNGSPLVYNTSVNEIHGVELAAAFDVLRGVEWIVNLPRVYAGSSMTLRVTNGVNYSPPLPEITATANTYSPDVRENRYVWSKKEQPEACPPLNYAFVGSGTILRMVPTRDALWIFCTDGLFRLSGDGGDGADAWRVDSADPNLLLAARNAVVTLKETIWCYCNRGLVAISDDGGIQEISLGVIGDTLIGASFADTWDVHMGVDQLHQEIWITFHTGSFGAGTTTSYVFNAVTKAFTTYSGYGDHHTASVYFPSMLSLATAYGYSSQSPSIYTFLGDTSGFRIPNAQIAYQPLFVNDPFDLKQFVDVTYIVDGLTFAATMTPRFDDVDSTAATMNFNASGESRTTIGVPRRCAIAPCIRPGFKLAGFINDPWSLRGVSVRFTPGGEETERD